MGLIIELTGIPMTVVNMTNSVGYLERNIAETKIALAGNQHIMLDKVIITSCIIREMFESWLDLVLLIFLLDSFTLIINKKCMIIITTEVNDSVKTVHHVITLIVKNEPVGSINGRHKLNGIFSWINFVNSITINDVTKVNIKIEYKIFETNCVSLNFDLIG